MGQNHEGGKSLTQHFFSLRPLSTPLGSPKHRHKGRVKASSVIAPSKVLLVENFDADCSEQTLQDLFAQYQKEGSPPPIVDFYYGDTTKSAYVGMDSRGVTDSLARPAPSPPLPCPHARLSHIYHK